MNTTRFKTAVSSLLAAVFFQSAVCAQSSSSIIYYGAVSNSSDTGIINMTQALFFTQLTQLEKYTIIDRQSIRYSDDALLSAGNATVFYVEIKEADGGWECTLHALNPSQKRHAEYSKTYDTYYKILTEAKTSLAAVLRDLENPSAAQTAPRAPPSGAVSPSLSSLAGNWSGDGTINKVVLLRGGKGFVIFKNGASMNIDVEIRGYQVVIVQSSKPNASFYPELPREVALVVAQTAAPIEWVFTMTDANTLTGTKKSVRFAAEGEGEKTEAAEMSAVWKRAP
jgi:hypothetical protein